MTALAMALPILPGKTEAWLRFIQEVTTERRAETDEFHQRFGLSRTSWFLQQTPQGDMFILYIEGEDPAAAFAAWAQSDHPYDQWFKEQAGSYYGVDLNAPPPGPPPEMLYEYSA